MIHICDAGAGKLHIIDAIIARGGGDHACIAELKEEFREVFEIDARGELRFDVEVVAEIACGEDADACAASIAIFAI